MDAAAHIVAAAGSQITGHHYVGAYGKTYEQIYQEVDQGRGGTHRRQRFLACKVAHYHHIRCIEQQLQQAG